MIGEKEAGERAPPSKAGRGAARREGSAHEGCSCSGHTQPAPATLQGAVVPQSPRLSNVSGLHLTLRRLTLGREKREEEEQPQSRRGRHGEGCGREERVNGGAAVFGNVRRSRGLSLGLKGALLWHLHHSALLLRLTLQGENKHALCLPTTSLSVSEARGRPVRAERAVSPFTDTRAVTFFALDDASFATEPPSSSSSPSPAAGARPGH